MEKADIAEAVKDLVAVEVSKRLAQFELGIAQEGNRGQWVAGGAKPESTYEVGYDFPWGGVYTCGLVRTGANKIKVVNCKARRFGDPQGSAIWYTCADKEVTFAGDGNGQKICWKWNPTNGLRIFDDPQTNDPMDDSTDICGVMAIFDVSNGRVELATGGVVQCGQPITLPVFTVAGT